jgi:hypothetical protein
VKESVPFTRTQSRLLNELKRSHEQAWFRELSDALAVIYDELGLAEKAKDGKHRFTLQPGFTGVDVMNTEPTPEIPGK